MKKFLILGLFLLLCPQLAEAQSQRNPCYYPSATSTSCIPVSSTNPLPVNASVSASVGGFHWEATLTPVSASTTPVTTTITAGKTIVIQNIGTTNSAYCALGGTTSANATAVPPNSSVSLTSTGETSLTCVTSASTTTLNLQSGTGLWGNFGGGSSGGGGGLSVIDQAAWTQGTSPFIPNGGVFNDSATLTSGQQGTQRLTTKRAAIVDVDTSGNALYSAITAPVPAGTNIIGKVGIDQTTPGTTNAVSTTNFPSTVSTGTGAQGASSPRVTVATDQATNAGAALVKGGVGIVNGGSTYAHVAASQTAQVLGATGAIGDYLSHCVIYPSATSAGSVTVFDNTNSAANNVIEFSTGTLSNLAPIAIPVGAVSVNGAWKVTTGATETVVCYGKFT